MYYACHGIGKTLATIWLPMLLATLLIVYAVFTLWVYANNFTRSRLVNFVFLAAYICYVGAFIILPFTDYWRLSIVSRIVITHEQVEILIPWLNVILNIYIYTFFSLDKNVNENSCVCERKCIQSIRCQS